MSAVQTKPQLKSSALSRTAGHSLSNYLVILSCLLLRINLSAYMQMCLFFSSSFLLLKSCFQGFRCEVLVTFPFFQW